MSDTRITVIENDNFTVWCYPADGIVSHQFHKYCYSDIFREMLTNGLEAFQKYHCTKWLSDDRKFGAILPADKDWADEFWQPKMLAAGWRYWAMVLPEKVTGKMNIEKVVRELEALGIVASYHTDPEVALMWLRKQR
jgi:hypothetical protein